MLPASATAFVLLSARRGAPYRSAFHTVKGNARLPGVCRYTVELKKKNHLMSKPIGLVRELLEITPEGGTVLDPFAGGGTTALAASKTGRKSINIELSEEYARRTVERLTEEQAA